MKSKKEVNAIVLADDSLPAEGIENYSVFINLYNSLPDGNKIYKVDWTENFHFGNTKNMKDLINSIDEIVIKIKPSDALFISQSIYDDVVRYCDIVDSYFELMCRTRNRMICVSRFLLETFQLNNGQN